MIESVIRTDNYHRLLWFREEPSQSDRHDGWIVISSSYTGNVFSLTQVISTYRVPGDNLRALKEHGLRFSVRKQVSIDHAGKLEEQPPTLADALIFEKMWERWAKINWDKVPAKQAFRRFKL